MSLLSADGKTLFIGRPSPVVASVYRAAAQAIASGAVTQVQIDTSGFAVGHSTNAPVVSLSAYKITAATAGYYRVNASAVLVSPAAPAAGSFFVLSIRLNGTEIRSSISALVANAYHGNAIETVTYMAAGDSVDMSIYQASGSSINTRTAANERAQIQVELLR